LPAAVVVSIRSDRLTRSAPFLASRSLMTMTSLVEPASRLKLYKLLIGFRETVFPSCWFERRLRVVRDLVFLVGADLIPDGRRLRVRFAVPHEERTEFLQRLRTLSEGLPIAAQLEWDLSDTADADQAPAHTPNAPVPTLRPSPHTPGASP
jgi:hypothetical protein